MASARLNLSDRRLAVAWAPGAEPEIGAVLERLDRLGYAAHPFDPRRPAEAEAAETERLIRAMAVAGFASMNVMLLLAISVWAGNASDMSLRTATSSTGSRPGRPAGGGLCGRPFYEGALRGLRAGRITMDVPITLGVVLTLAMSVVETAGGRSTPISTARSCCCSSC